MLSTKEIREIIKKGETGRVEFKSDKEKNIDFAKEIAAFANGSGGYLLVGVEDDGTVSGVSNPSKFEEKIYNICSDSIRPVVAPELWEYKIEEKDVFCFYISAGFSKPYAILQRRREKYYTRRGTRIQEASRDELLRLFQTSGQIHYEATPTIKRGYADLDFTRIADFSRHNQINRIDISGWKSDRIKRFLKNKEVLAEYQGSCTRQLRGYCYLAKNLLLCLVTPGLQLLNLQILNAITIM